jgi:hypothetical protein
LSFRSTQFLEAQDNKNIGRAIGAATPDRRRSLAEELLDA